MPPLAGDRVRAREHAAVHHDPAAGARADDHAEHDARARGRAVGRLRQREAVGVVGGAHLPPERLRQVAVDRAADEPGRVRVLDEPARRRQRPRHAHAHAALAPGLLLDRLDERRDGADRRVVVVARRRDAPPRELAAVGVEGDRLDLRPAEIDPDPHRERFSLTGRAVGHRLRGGVSHPAPAHGRMRTVTPGRGPREQPAATRLARRLWPGYGPSSARQQRGGYNRRRFAP